VRMGSSEEDLVIFLSHPLLIDEYDFGNDGAGLQLALSVEVRDIADNEVVTLESNCITLFDNASNVLVMTDQCLEH
jgi:hypothetical protein